MNQTTFYALTLTICGVLCGTMELCAQSDPALVIRTKTGESAFYVGERIPLELSFTSSSEKRYEINLARYDRSGRVHSEQFNVTPRKGWADPLTAYFANGYAGGGLSSSAVLSSSPEVIELDLNEWVRFDEPGNYEVSVSSSRVSDPGKPEAVELRSNALTLRVIPAPPKWQEFRLNTALATLRVVPATEGMTPEARTGAIADIRYLRSKAAIRVMAAGVRDDRRDELYAYAFGLIGLPRSLRDEATGAMQVQIDDPEFPISGWFLNVEAQLLNTSEGVTNVEGVNRFRELAWRKSFASLSRKTGQALANTADTLLNLPPDRLDDQERAQLSSSLSKAFLDLSPERQTATLLANWDLLRSDAMEPSLRKLAELPLADPANNLSTIYATRKLKAAALLRWYDLNPDEAIRAALQQVGSASPSLTEGDLVFLKDHTMPQHERVWADALLSETSYTKETALAGLLARFGTGSALPAVIEKLSKNVGHWACAPQGAALAYVVEFDPEHASGLLQRAVAARGKESSACNHSVFQDVATYTSGPVVTDSAIQAINDPDPQVAMDALIYLMFYGDKRAKQPIWDRYVQWSETWKGRAAALGARQPGGIGDNWEQQGLGENLATALISNQGWLSDKELILQILNRCVGEQMCTKLKQLAASAYAPYRVSLYRFGRTENDTIAQYAEKNEALLQEKLDQFPRGTSFIMKSDSTPSEEQQAFESHIRALFEKAGMSLVMEKQ